MHTPYAFARTHCTVGILHCHTINLIIIICVITVIMAGVIAYKAVGYMDSSF
uniref:Uncharacterized protein n=1 Tax=Anguilla anguilla TaxID=7936 RepID=A0A0E9XXX3_ANGAN